MVKINETKQIQKICNKLSLHDKFFKGYRRYQHKQNFYKSFGRVIAIFVHLAALSTRQYRYHVDGM